MVGPEVVAPAGPSLKGHVMKASCSLTFSNTRSRFVECVTNENMKEKTGSQGRKQEPEWLMAKERRQEKKEGVIV